MTAVGKCKQAAVLDTAREGQRRLAELVSATGIAVREAADLDELGRLLSTDGITVAVVAYEALWPDPHRAARALKKRAPHARLVAVHTGSALLRLGEGLWLIGLFDFFVGRSTPPHQLRPLLRQAHADALLEIAEEGGADADAESDASMRFLDRISAAFSNQSRVDGLLRELRTKLPSFLEYHLLQVLVIDPVSETGKLYLFQSRRLVHEVIWTLAERICDAVSPYMDGELLPGQLTFVEPPPMTDTPPGSDAGPVDPALALTLPMVQCGELVGCIGLLPRSAGGITAEQLKTLKLVSYELAVSLRAAQALRVAEDLHGELEALQENAHADRLEAVATVIAGQAHEITTPISSARTAAEMALRGAETLTKLVGDTDNEEVTETLDELKEACDLVERNINRAFTLIKAFRNQSARQLSDEVMTVDLKEVISDCIYAMRPETKKQGVVAHLHAPEGKSFLWNGFPGLFTQVIVNMFQNALRHAYADGKSGTIDIRLSVADEMYHVEFEDHGVGIPESVLPRIFEAAFTTARDRGGSGIGLNISKDIVTKQLKGSLNCTSEFGKGTVMIIEVPRDLQDDPEDDDD